MIERFFCLRQKSAIMEYIIHRREIAQVSMIIRTDFSDDAAWQTVCQAVEAGEFYDAIESLMNFVDDRAYSGVTAQNIPALLTEVAHQGTIYLVDSMTISHPDHPLLVIDLYEFRQSGSLNTFRSVPDQIAGIECNLSISNMDFESFADNVDEDGIFRGFEE
jgi:hypothetical protein